MNVTIYKETKKFYQQILTKCDNNLLTNYDFYVNIQNIKGIRRMEMEEMGFFQSIRILKKYFVRT